MKNNVEGTIDDLLEDVDQALLAGYAQKHGRSLKWANAAYKMVCRDRDALRRKGSILFWSWVLGILAVACYAPAAILELLGLCALMILWQVLVLRSWRREADAATEYQCMLAKFRTAVEALNLEGSPCTRCSVRVMLVKSAAELLAAQQFLEKHRHGQYSAEILFNSCRVEADCSLNFDRRVQAAEEFGLTFKKAELFRDAAAILSCLKI